MTVTKHTKHTYTNGDWYVEVKLSKHGTVKLAVIKQVKRDDNKLTIRNALQEWSVGALIELLEEIRSIYGDKMDQTEGP